MLIKIPTSLIDSVILQIETDIRFIDLNEKGKSKLTKRLIELWFFIYNRQIIDSKTLNLNFFTNISKSELNRFDIMLSGQRIYYSDLLKILNNLIEVNDKYSVGNFTSGYKIKTDFIRFTNLTEIDLDLDKIFLGTKNKEYWLKRYPALNNLIEDCYNTSIDLDNYHKWLLDNLGLELDPVYNKTTGLLEKRFLTDDKVYSYLISALKVNIKNLWFKLSNEGRFYSSISNLPKSAIRFIKLYNERTTSIDLKNCQPLLLSILINNEKFKLDCEMGLFYDNLLNELSLGESSSLKRPEVKVMCYKYIFFGSNELKSGRLYEAMEKLYSGVISNINHIKRDKKLANELQRIESNIFVKNIGKIKMPKLIRHDEVIVSENNRLKMEMFMLKELERLNIKIKYKL